MQFDRDGEQHADKNWSVMRKKARDTIGSALACIVAQTLACVVLSISLKVD